MKEILKCYRCHRVLESDYRFCPGCGLQAPAESEGRVDEIALHYTLEVARAREEEIRAIRLWRQALVPLLLAGMFLLIIPDAAVLFVFQKWVRLPFSDILEFLLIDGVIGATVVSLVYFSRQRGGAADLLLLAIRFGQMPMLIVMGLMPFRDPLLGVMLLLFLPMAILGFSALVLRMHLTDIFDALARRSSVFAVEAGNEQGNKESGENQQDV